MKGYVRDVLDTKYREEESPSVKETELNEAKATTSKQQERQSDKKNLIFWSIKHLKCEIEFYFKVI